MHSGHKLRLAAIAALIASICLLNYVSPASDAQPAASKHVEDNKSFKLPRLFDFEFYKERFGKRYASLAEELARKSYFVACAFRAFVSGMRYKWRKASHFLAVNHMSDMSPQEKAARKNQVQRAAASQPAASIEVPPADASRLPEFRPAEGEDYEQAVKDLLEKHGNEPGYRELMEAAQKSSSGSDSRKKRSVDAAELGPRDFSLDALIQPGVHQVVPEPAEVRAKITSNVPGNNPNYQPPEVLTEGLNDNHAELSRWWIKPKEDPRPIHKQLDNSLISLAGRMFMSLPVFNQNGARGQDDLGDRVYFDHRDSHCLTTPRSQGQCGSCYAFAATALMEWLYCTKRGKLVPFSEQYMVDCGNKRFGNIMLGCNGATDYAVFKFIHNFGVERQASYPYTEREHQCPYDDGTDLKAAGYIRMELGDFTYVPVSRWSEFIQYGPLYFSIASPTDYDEYAGGVHDGQSCPTQADHAQLLVGHGREDGKDYWLIRNSYGPKWGEGGYWKLSKDAPERCIEMQRGYALGTKDARDYEVTPEENRNNPQVMREQYLRSQKATTGVRGGSSANVERVQLKYWK